MFRFLSLAATLAVSAFAHAQTAPTQTIPAVQGRAEESPFARQNLTLEGIVTGVFSGGDKLGGFFLQDPQGDGDPQTSDGLFIYQPPRTKGAQTAVQVGQRVRVVGRVSERQNQTQLSASLVEILDEAPQPVAPTEIALPLPPGVYFERYEGMLVRFGQTLVVTGNNELESNGTLALSSARQFNPTNQNPIEEVRANANQTPRVDRVLLDDGSTDRYPKNSPYFDADKTRRTGSGVRDLVGVLSFVFDNYSVQPTQTVRFEDLNPRSLEAPKVGGTLKIAGANLYNYWTTLKNQDEKSRGSEGPAQFGRQSRKTVAMLRGLDADIVGLMELENNGEGAIGFLVSELNKAYGAPVYDFIRDPQTGVGDDAIKVGLIFKTQSVAPVGESLSDPGGIFDRKPVAQTFRDLKSGGVLTVVVNHFKSKGSPPETGDVDAGEGAWNQRRVAQSRALLRFIEQLKTQSGDPDILALGDFNAYVHEAPLLALREGGLQHLNLRLNENERYSFSFDGLFGSLDHAFATPSLDAQVTGIGEWHINADEPYFLAYNRVKVSEFQDNPFRASDHDPILVGVEPK